MDFRSSDYGEAVARLLALDGDGLRAIPLSPDRSSSQAAREELQQFTPATLFPHAFSPQGAMAGLYLYYSCVDDAHNIAQNLSTTEGSFWHGILHRQEPDPVNAAYWFRKVGKHSVFPELRTEAHRLRFDTGAEWDPFEFIEFCESARVRPGSEEERIALRIQLTEWQLLFDFCAREKSH